MIERCNSYAIISSCPNNYKPFNNNKNSSLGILFPLCCGKNFPFDRREHIKAKSGKVWSNSPTCKLTGARLIAQVTISKLFRRCCSSLTHLLGNKLNDPPFNACGPKVCNLQTYMEKVLNSKPLFCFQAFIHVKDEFKIHYTIHIIQRGPHYE